MNNNNINNQLAFTSTYAVFKLILIYIITNNKSTNIIRTILYLYLNITVLNLQLKLYTYI